MFLFRARDCIPAASRMVRGCDGSRDLGGDLGLEDLGVTAASAS